jgi:pimeloyl-ACP methyl ester carboxylesterase
MPLTPEILVGLTLVAVSLGAVQAGETWPGERLDTWHGYVRHNFVVDGCAAWVVEPKQPAPGNPWTWCLEFPDAFTERTGVLQLLEKGFHHVHISVGNTFGCPAAVKLFEEFYRVLQAGGLAKKGTLIGISRGGLYAYNFAAKDPTRIACIYGDAAVCDFKSWPGGKGQGKGSPGDWAALIKDYGFKDEMEALAYPRNPVDALAPLATAKIAMIHVVGDVDKTVPPEENALIIERRYRELGGTVLVIHKPGGDHHPHGLDNPQPIVDFILEQTARASNGAPPSRP